MAITITRPTVKSKKPKRPKAGSTTRAKGVKRVKIRTFVG